MMVVKRNIKMRYAKRIEEIEKQFIKYSDEAQDLVAFIRKGLTRNMPIDDLVDMQKGIVKDLNEAMALDQEYMRLSGQEKSHPNYEKFVVQVGIAKSALDLNVEIASKDSELESELGFQQ